MRLVRVVDLFSGVGGWSRAFRERGHQVITVDIEAWFEPDIVADVKKLHREDLPPGPVDMVLASPPCEGFSISSVRWNYRDGVPYGYRALDGIECVKATLRLIEELDPRYFIIENPRGMLHKLDLIPYERRYITQCTYGKKWQKPTHLWGGFPPSLKLKEPCAQGAACHLPQPRSNYNAHATQKWPWWYKAAIPRRLSLAACRAAERDLKE